METNHKTPDIELRSEEVQELMGKIPPVILRVGISIILCFVIFLLIVSNFIKYPDIIKIPIVAKNINNISEVVTLESGQIVNLNMDYRRVYKGDTLAKIITNKEGIQNAIYVRSQATGVIYPYEILQENDYVESNDILCVIVDSIREQLTAKAFISAEIKKRIMPNMAIESNIEDIILQGKVVSIADHANPKTGKYTMTMVFKKNEELKNTVIWNYHTNVKIKITEHSLFYKFYKGIF